MTIPKPLISPLPIQRDTKSAFFFDSARDDRLAVAVCADCDAVLAPESMVCVRCAGTRLEPGVASGAATLVTWTVVHRAPNPLFADCVPYVVGVVELTEGPWMYARIDVRQPEAGMPLSASFVHPAEGESYPVFGDGSSDG
ncbi:Zn-ribbon domain-containing OB-fold protein [Mycobacteroides immunogenum]|uniref:Zn-ribbon domain-containing OB-fold protein n=1 Tax=Mycobacteroides immunogenum TaxID=83262 RepID=UPI0005C2A3A2|nr:OB-fold domain-containing protein [Mycobacteroides immunogenum]ANO05447.1 hypothetical protein BAB75_20735 [Mycobacteroides immunogenum]KIU37564.1 hypothetical protein TL11_27030 [Mycobacteroides immunogenum]MCV7308621.1 OB-fold domain-containing protein [Mycobacteroides immunogenum]ORV80348.1 hypothetical protein AWC10_05790 [Mycobacteroides immunogenum]